MKGSPIVCPHWTCLQNRNSPGPPVYFSRHDKNYSSVVPCECLMGRSVKFSFNAWSPPFLSTMPHRAQSYRHTAFPATATSALVVLAWIKDCLIQRATCLWMAGSSLLEYLQSLLCHMQYIDVRGSSTG